MLIWCVIQSSAVTNFVLPIAALVKINVGLLNNDIDNSKSKSPPRRSFIERTSYGDTVTITHYSDTVWLLTFWCLLVYVDNTGTSRENCLRSSDVAIPYVHRQDNYYDRKKNWVNKVCWNSKSIYDEWNISHTSDM